MKPEGDRKSKSWKYSFASVEEGRDCFWSEAQELLLQLAKEDEKERLKISSCPKIRRETDAHPEDIRI